MSDENTTTQEPMPEVQSPAPKKSTRRFNIAGIAALLLVTGAVAASQYFGVIDLRTMGSGAGLAINATDPDAVVATVNGQEIKNAQVEERLAQIKNVLSAQGADLTQPGVLDEYRSRIVDELIDNQLLLQAAEKEGITVTDEEVTAEYNELVTMFGGEEALKEQMSLVGIDDEALRKNLREQKIIEAYVANHSEIETIEVTDEEALAAYNQSVGENTEGAPAFDDVKNMLKEQIAQEKASSLIALVVQDLKTNATIEKN